MHDTSESNKFSWHAFDDTAGTSQAISNYIKGSMTRQKARRFLHQPSDSFESASSGAEADNDDPKLLLRKWAHKVTSSSSSSLTKPKRLKKVQKRVAASSAPNFKMIEEMLAPNMHSHST